MLPCERLVVFRHMMEGLEQISKIEIPQVHETANPPLTLDSLISNFRPIASYSWLDTEDAAIVVPGSPPVFNADGASLPFSVPEDSAEDHTIHWRTHTLPFNLEPLVSAVQQQELEFPFGSLHLVTERAFLLKLLGWIRHSADLDFCFDIQLVGSTMLCTHCAVQPKFIGTGGYGRNFEHAVTVAQIAVTGAGPAAAEQMDHYRIVRYNFCGMELLVRFEVDACFPPGAQHTGGSAESPDVSSPHGRSPSGIKVVPAGTFVEQARVAELKSLRASAKKANLWKKTFPQLLFSQTPNVLVGIHEYGQFYAIEQHSLDDIPIYRDRTEDDMKKLASVLRRVYDLVVAEGEGPAVLLSLACVGGELGFYRRRDGRQALPAEMMSLFQK